MEKFGAILMKRIILISYLWWRMKIKMSQYASKKQETNSDQNVPISKNSKYSVEQQFKKNV